MLLLDWVFERISTLEFCSSARSCGPSRFARSTRRRSGHSSPAGGMTERETRGVIAGATPHGALNCERSTQTYMDRVLGYFSTWCISPTSGVEPVRNPFTTSYNTMDCGLLTSRNAAACTSSPRVSAWPSPAPEDARPAAASSSSRSRCYRCVRRVSRVQLSSLPRGAFAAFRCRAGGWSAATAVLGKGDRRVAKMAPPRSPYLLFREAR